MIPIEHLKASRLADAEFGDLFFGRETLAKVLVGGVDGVRYAVFLDGDHAGRGFAIDANQTRDGFVVRGVRIDVDHTSFVSSDFPQGSVALGALGAQIHARVSVDGWLQGRWLSLSDLAAEGAGLVSAGAFTRWRLVLPLPDGSVAPLFSGNVA